MGIATESSSSATALAAKALRFEGHIFPIVIELGCRSNSNSIRNYSYQIPLLAQEKLFLFAWAFVCVQQFARVPFLITTVIVHFSSRRIAREGAAKSTPCRNKH